MQKQTYHFIGMGGIGMSALARILLQHGHEVQGSDASASTLLEELQKEGATVRVGQQEGGVPPHATVVYSTDIKEHNIEFVSAKKMGLPMLHRSDLLARLMLEKKPLLVTGTHGKTTTSALLAHVLIEAKLDPTFVVGGILHSLQSNARAGKGDYFVAEADESDGSFLKTAAFGAIVTNLENDHLDFWKTEAALDAAFGAFCAQVKKSEHLIWCYDDERLAALRPKGISYGFCMGADCRIVSHEQTEQGSLFDLLYEGHLYRRIPVALYGRHNVLNAAAVFALCLSLGIPEEQIRQALQSFRGTHRRLEFKGEAHRLKMYDDYGHHPTEIAATLRALRDHIRERRLVAIFQPHRFTRVRDQMDHFATSFADADLVLMTDIYSAREAPIEGVTTEILFEKMKQTLGAKLHYLPRASLEREAAEWLQPFDVAITIGAGDVTHAGKPILDHFAKRAPKYTIGVLCGGTSVEHEVSLRSGKTVVDALDRTLCDVKLFRIDKEAWTKQIAILHNIPTAPFIEIDRLQFMRDPKKLLQQIAERHISYPIYVKPVHLGSSIAVSRAITPDEVITAAKEAFRVDDHILVEQEIRGREIEVSVLGNDYVRIAAPAEMMKSGLYTYEMKYGNQPIEKRIPAPITESQLGILRELTHRTYVALHGQGLARIDFFLDEEGHFWLNEVNPFPGFTTASGYPKMWAASGLTIQQLCEEFLVLALHKSRRQATLRGSPCGP
ncbi:MAG: UDP-N-acetylmuramate--L-alanine ligase [Chlamydiia bacterium]|nr:UDP-N-acetylmuramate--L-alanine ligase [Chlamydiia bacterium]